MKIIKREEPIIRNRFSDCPDCKTRNFKVKKTIEVGRCRNCRESYKVITVYAKTGVRTKTISTKPAAEIGQPTQEPSLPSWQLPSDTSLFETTEQGQSTFSNPSFAWDTQEKKDESGTTSGQ